VVKRFGMEVKGGRMRGCKRMLVGPIRLKSIGNRVYGDDDCRRVWPSVEFDCGLIEGVRRYRDWFVDLGQQ
jgi:hypothetical protein